MPWYLQNVESKIERNENCQFNSSYYILSQPPTENIDIV